MGWFSNIWSGIKNIGSKVLDGAKYVGGKVSSAFDTVKNIGSKIANIPVIGDIAKTIVASNPIAQSALNGFNMADRIVQRGNDIIQNIPGGG